MCVSQNVRTVLLSTVNAARGRGARARPTDDRTTGARENGLAGTPERGGAPPVLYASLLSPGTHTFLTSQHTQQSALFVCFCDPDF